METLLIIMKVLFVGSFVVALVARIYIYASERWGKDPSGDLGIGILWIVIVPCCVVYLISSFVLSISTIF